MRDGMRRFTQSREARISWRRSRWTGGVFAALACVAAVALMTAFGWMRGLERGSMDGLFRARGVRFPGAPIVLLVVDDPTVTQQGRWPLSRSTYARTVDLLKRGGARTVAFDLIFATPSDRPSEDRAFEMACAGAGNVVHAATFYVPLANSPMQPTTRRADRFSLEGRFALQNQGNLLPESDRAATWVSSAEPNLRIGAGGLGHVNIYPEWDGALRRISDVIAYRGALYPSLALAAAAHFSGIEPHDVIVERRELRLGAVRAQIDGNGERWINWVGGNRSFPTYSLGDLLSGRLQPELFKDKLVFIGATASGTFEHRPTPFSPVQPSVEMQANAADDLISGRTIIAMPDVWRWIAAFAFALFVGVIAVPRGAYAGFFITIIGSIVLWQGAVMLLKRDIYAPFSTALLSGALTYAMASALSYRREWEANLRADVSIALLAQSASLLSARLEGAGALAVVEEAAREALGAYSVRVVFEDETGPAGDLARALADDGRAALWPAPRSDDGSHAASLRRRVRVLGRSSNLPHRARAGPALVLETLMQATFTEVRRPSELELVSTLIVAPLPPLARSFDETARPQRARGALLVVGRDEASLDAFNERDAALAEALARQAQLALENANYDARLQARVEAADKGLRDAYSLLEMQSARLAAAAEGVDDALIIVDGAGRAAFVNAASARILREGAPALGADVREALRTGGLDDLCALWDKAESGERAQVETARVTVLADDRDFAPEERTILSAQLVPLEDEEKSAMLLVADITAQRELDNMKSDFVAFVAHELRTPLTSILGFASLLQNESAHFSQEERDHMAQNIVQRGQRLNRMIAELLDVSRLDAGRPLQLRHERIDLAELCEKVVEAQKAAISEPDLYFLYVDASDSVIIEADADRVDQVLTNLVSNAVKYSPDGGTVRVGLEEAGDNVIISVDDAGMGMTPEQQSRLFTKYYRTPDAVLHNIKGTGLGLFLVKQLVEAHGGSIRVQSARGQGSSFTVTLPRKAQHKGDGHAHD